MGEHQINRVTISIKLPKDLVGDVKITTNHIRRKITIESEKSKFHLKLAAAFPFGHKYQRRYNKETESLEVSLFVTRDFHPSSQFFLKQAPIPSAAGGFTTKI